MRTEAVTSANIEVCDACGGLWVDWFDGEVHTLAAEAEAARVERGALPPGIAGAAAAAAPSAGCPRCHRALSPELHRFADAHDAELVTGVELHRCPECAGSFVPRSSAHLLLDRARAPRAATLWEAIVFVLRRLVGPRSPAG